MFFANERKFFKYFVDDKKSLLKYFVLSIIVGILELFGVALTYPFIVRILSKTGMDRNAVIMGVLIIAAFLAKNIFMIFYNSLQANYTKRCEADINKKFMNYFINGDYSVVSKVSLANKNHILGFLSSNVINNFLLRVLNLNVNLLVFALITGFLFYKFFTATIITFGCSVLLLLSQALFFKWKTMQVSNGINESNKNLNTAVNDALLNIKSVKVSSGEKFIYERYLEKLDINRKNAVALLFYSAIPPYVTEPFIIIILLILIAIISVQNINQPANLVASYAVVVSAIFRLAPAISRIQVNFTGICTTLPQVKEIVSYYENFHLDKLGELENIELHKFDKSIELKDICFAYGENKVLKDVSCRINKGEFVGITGASGVGKTTLVDIIAGLLNITSGQIYIDGDFIRAPKVPRLKIGYIPQNFGIISASIRDNVAFGAENPDDARVIEVLKMAQLYDYISENFEEGIYAKPFVDSSGFSQGQKQRLAIARALYSNPDIIILDEATSSLDLKTEDEVCEVLNKLKGEKTIIAIAHRFSTIKSADKILFMKDSSISDIGTYEELYNRNSDFKELALLNESYFIH